MDNRVNALFFKYTVNKAFIADIPLVKACLGMYRRLKARFQIICHDNLKALLYKLIHGVRAYVARAAQNQNFSHCFTSYLMRYAPTGRTAIMWQASSPNTLSISFL